MKLTKQVKTKKAKKLTTYLQSKVDDKETVTRKAQSLSDAEKDEIQGVVLRELMISARGRIAMLEEVLGRKVTIVTNVPMSETDTRIFSMELK